MKSAVTIKRIAEILGKYKVKADFWLSGLIAQNMAEHAPEIVEVLKRLEMSIRYHGDIHCPFPTPFEMTQNMNWDKAIETMYRWETQKLDPVTGELDPSKVGGWKAVTEIFGEPPIIGVAPGGAAHEYVQKKLGGRLVRLPDYIGRRTFYLASILHCRRGLPRNMIGGENKRKVDHPVETFKLLMRTLSPNRVTLVTVVMHPCDFYDPWVAAWWLGAHAKSVPTWPYSSVYRDVCPPHQAMSNPPIIMAPPVRSKEEIEENFKEFEEFIAFLANHPSIRVVTYKDLSEMFGSEEKGIRLTQEEIVETAKYLLYNWEDIRPPNFVKLENNLSLAEAFQALVYSLAHYAENESLPTEVTIKEIAGPVDTPKDLGLQGMSPALIVSGENVLEATVSISFNMKDRVPGIIKLPLEGGKVINASEMLFIMAQELNQIRENGEPGPVLFLAQNILPPNVQIAPAGSTFPPDRSRWEKISMKEWIQRLHSWTQKPL